jgi:hypothetical protein
VRKGVKSRHLLRLRHENLALDPPPGPTLAERVARGPLDAAAARRLAHDLCAGLTHAHAEGLVHGRLGPDAVVADGERWVISGFGEPGEADERDDVRAVGALIYLALTGQAPARGELAYQGLPRDLRAPVLRSLHDDKERRYGTLAEMARALGVADDAPPPPPRRVWPALVAGGVLVALAVGVAVRARAGRSGAGPATAVVPPLPRVAVVDAGVGSARERRVVVVAPFTAPGEAAWLGPGVAAMMATALAEVPELEVVRSGNGTVVEGTIEPAGAGYELAARLVDPASGATLAAERAAVADLDDVVVKSGVVAARLAAVLAPGARVPPLPGLTSASAAAWRAWLEGGEDALRRAAALDGHFFQPRAALAALLATRGRADAARAVLDEARPLASHAGVAGRLALARLEARTPAERVAALEFEAVHTPHDLALAAELAAAYRAAGRPGECAAAATRAGAPAAADLARCRLASGDAEGALAAATASGDALLAGDVALMLGRTAPARAAYLRVGAPAAARLALWALRAQGKCKAAVHIASLDDARVVAALALACGDAERARAAEAAARRFDASAADGLALAWAAARGEPGTYARAAARAAGATWAADGLDRAERYGPVLAAARAEKVTEALGGFTARPSDGFALFEEPLLFEAALAQADLGAPDAAAESCRLLGATAPALARYCAGRVAEAKGDYAAAFQDFRAFLDGWSDADPDHRLVREAIRRSRLAVVRVRQPKTP